MAASQSNRFKEGVTGVTNEVVSIPRSEKSLDNLYGQSFTIMITNSVYILLRKVDQGQDNVCSKPDLMIVFIMSCACNQFRKRRLPCGKTRYHLIGRN